MGDDQSSREHLRRSFAHFAEICRDAAPLYGELSPRIADDDAIVTLAAGAAARQPAPNLLFGAVHDLLLRGTVHPLRQFYPSVGGAGDPREAWPAFRDFIVRHRDAIAHMVQTRRVQTNEVGRCGPLLLGFAAIERLCPGHPIAIIEVGASAGLNLRFDRYQYECTDDAGRTTVVPAVTGSSDVSIRTRLRGSSGNTPLIPSAMPQIVSRIGIDIAPVDIHDRDAMRWVEALIWPDDVDRLMLFRSAVDAALRDADPPRTVVGDALDRIADLLAAAPRDAIACVYHTHATYQTSREWRDAFEARLAAASRALRRDIAHLSIEWLGDDPGPKMRLRMHAADDRPTHEVHLADCHHHGRWLEWKEQNADV